MRHIEIRRTPGGRCPVDDPHDPGICLSWGRHVEQHVAGLEVPVQEPPFIRRCGPADHVDRRGPYRRVGALGSHDGVGGRQRHVLPGPFGGSHRVDRHELTGQQGDARLQSLIVEDCPSRQMCHQEGRILAIRGGRINRDQCGSRHAGPREQGQGAGLPVQPVLGVLHVDEGPQHQVTGAAVRRADGQPPHFGGDAAVQRLGFDDPFADLQVPAHPRQGQWSDSRRLIVVGHRATSSSRRRHPQRLSLETTATLLCSTRGCRRHRPGTRIERWPQRPAVRSAHGRRAIVTISWLVGVTGPRLQSPYRASISNPVSVRNASSVTVSRKRRHVRSTQATGSRRIHLRGRPLPHYPGLRGGSRCVIRSNKSVSGSLTSWPNSDSP